MARMRSVKPEFWSDEDLAQLPRDARLLYVGLWNLADEHSRLRGDPRYVKGQLFPYDDDLDADSVAKLLQVLAAAGKLRRYRVNGAAYLYLPNLSKHQRLETDKVPSRLPSPPDADEPEPPLTPRANKSARDSDVSVPRTKDHALKHVAGGMEHVAGGMEHVPPPAGTALTLVPRANAPASTDEMIAEWITHCRKRPPNNVIGQVGKQVRAMLAEGIDPPDVRAGLAEWWRKGLHPSALPSVVNELMNAAPARASPRGSTTDSRVGAALAIAEDLERLEIES